MYLYNRTQLVSLLMPHSKEIDIDDVDMTTKTAYREFSGVFAKYLYTGNKCFALVRARFSGKPVRPIFSQQNFGEMS